MQTTFLGLTMAQALEQIKKVLIGKGYSVQLMPTSDPVLLAFQDGSWLRKPKQLILEISSASGEQTRVDVTAITPENNNARLERIIEGKFIISLRNAFGK